VFRRDCFKPNCATTLFNQRDSARQTPYHHGRAPIISAASSSTGCCHRLMSINQSATREDVALIHLMKTEYFTGNPSYSIPLYSSEMNGGVCAQPMFGSGAASVFGRSAGQTDRAQELLAGSGSGKS
jgi:hypothetical protein